MRNTIFLLLGFLELTVAVVLIGFVIARFVGPRTVVAAVEEDTRDANYEPLQDNLKRLWGTTDLDGRPLEVHETHLAARQPDLSPRALFGHELRGDAQRSLTISSPRLHPCAVIEEEACDGQRMRRGQMERGLPALVRPAVGIGSVIQQAGDNC